MRFSTYADDRPNGFHDSLVNSIEVNYGARRIVLTLDLWVGRMSGEKADRETRRRGVLTGEDLVLFSLTPPDWSYNWEIDGPIDIDLRDPGSDFELLGKRFDGVDFQLLQGFLANTNSFLYIAARRFSFQWAT